MRDNVAAVIVTSNRLSLLKETVRAVKSQTFPIGKLIVVNNGSTDGTRDWLNRQQHLVVIHQSNTGGSGGFYTGIKAAIDLMADWVWVMDDDTICRKNTLEKLIEKLLLVNEKIGFIGSKCVWSDENPHLMNIPAIKPSFDGRLPFNRYDELNLLLTETCSFVSLLINADAVRAVGLPYKEFFIWGDDQEYTRRISRAGFLGFYCADSLALHKTPGNYFPDFYTDNVQNLWKHKYGFRNEFFMIKKERGFLYFIFWLVAKVGYTSFKLLKKRTSNRPRFIFVLLNSAWNSIFFNPKINQV
jgi:rhamnopyranosyl-N-acetylglucosaminyl-diphospho-decaprenol beta-1,3/1,4-galactofuranosyltransferase